MKPQEINDYLREIGSAEISGSTRIDELTARPTVSLDVLARKCGFTETDAEVIEAAEIEIKYHGYIARERALAEKMVRLEAIPLRGHIDYAAVQSLSTEARQKLTTIDPDTLAEASRIPGVSPSDIAVLMVLLGR